MERAKENQAWYKYLIAFLVPVVFYFLIMPFRGGYISCNILSGIALGEIMAMTIFFFFFYKLLRTLQSAAGACTLLIFMLTMYSGCIISELAGMLLIDRFVSVFWVEKIAWLFAFVAAYIYIFVPKGYKTVYMMGYILSALWIAVAMTGAISEYAISGL